MRRRNRARVTQKQTGKKTALILGICALITAGVVLYVNMSGLGNGQLPFTGNPNAVYQQAGTALASNQPDAALVLYRQIDHMPQKADTADALQPLIWYHEAEAQAKLGHESDAQNTLRKLQEAYPHTPYELMALYALGQSAIRVQQAPMAQESFLNLVERAPHSNLATGAQYYLGQLALANHQPAEALKHWRLYLSRSADGRFSPLIAQSMPGLPGLASADNALIGRVYAAAKQWPQAISWFKKSPFPAVWLPYSQALLATGQTAAAQAMLNHGLFLPGQNQDAETAIRLLERAQPDRNHQKLFLAQLSAKPIQSGRDFILWQLRRLDDGPDRLVWSQKLLDSFPTSKWAPECAWDLIWHAYQTGDYPDFLKRADDHLARYPHSFSAPRVLFWKAKYYMGQGKSELAHALFDQIPVNYPHQYYAFRARQILSGDTHPWQTNARDAYPPAASKITLARPDLAVCEPDTSLRPALTQLITMQDSTDLTLLTQTQTTPNPVMAALTAGLNRQYNVMLQTIGDVLESDRKAGQGVCSPDVYYLFYPVVFRAPIETSAQRNHLDPYLVQALMRQESYFNPQAVSTSNALGLMQLLPGTGAGVAKSEHLAAFSPNDLLNPDVNVRLGTRYLRYLMDKFNGNAMLAVGSYNGGPNAAARWVQTLVTAKTDPDVFIESIPYTESRDYIKSVFSHYWNYKALYLH